MTTKLPESSTELGAAGQLFWADVVFDYVLNPVELTRLMAICTQLDRAEAARAILDEKGIVFEDRWGQPRERPEVSIERQATIEFRKGLSLLRLGELDGPRRRVNNDQDHEPADEPEAPTVDPSPSIYANGHTHNRLRHPPHAGA